jgi:hypothetical protein
MAITKIMNIGASRQGDIGTHLSNALVYIANEEKTENGALVGYINCMEGMVYDQMCQTKKLYGKVGGRQGYHFVISFVPGEGSREQMFDIIREFAEEFLQGEYEAMYSVHTDKNHIHGHLIFNSVNLVTGKKYEYKKGDWKKKIQPITNGLCEKYGLSIMPAEYSKEPLNMNREQWEQEQYRKKTIEEDVRHALSKAKDYTHFLYLLECLGYIVKQGEHLAVKTPDMKRYRRLDTICEKYTVSNIQKGFENGTWNGYVLPKVRAINPNHITKPQNAFQEQYYNHLYYFAVVEKRRYYSKAARFQKQLQQLHAVHKEYMYLCHHEIDDWIGIFKEMYLQEQEMDSLSAKQKELYREHTRRKRDLKTEDDVAEFVLWEEAYYKELEHIKKRKHFLKDELRVAKRCVDCSEIATQYYEKIQDYLLGNPYDVEAPDMPAKEQAADMPVMKQTEDINITGETVMPVQNKSVETIMDVTERVAEFTETGTFVEEGVTGIRETGMFVEEAVTQITEMDMDTPMTKERYEALSDKEKIEWLGIDTDDFSKAIQRFNAKMAQLGIQFASIGDSADEFIRLQNVMEKEQRRECGSVYWEERRGR